MKFAFLGLKNSFDYFQIGGTESFVRRISNELIQTGIKVDYILYGNTENKKLEEFGITLKYFTSFDNAIKAIENEKYEQIVTIYLLPRDRIKYTLFRKRRDTQNIFHFIYFSWPDSLVKRYIYFYEARIFPFNGKLFCLSKRQYEYVRKWTKNAIYLLPPVPEEYFLRLEEKPVNDKIKITFLGRIDPGKGINEVIEIFKVLKGDNRFECSIYGILIPEHKLSLQIYNWLKSQKDIQYIEIDRQKYSPAIEEFVKNILKETDILIQPYKKLSSTIDTPLLLLEAMASLCAAITKPFGNIPDIYGESKFLIYPENFVKDVLELLNKITIDDLLKERERIYDRNKVLNFKAENITKKFLEAIKS